MITCLSHGPFLRMIIRNKHWSISSLAKKLGISRSCLYNNLHKPSLSRKLIRAVAAAAEIELPEQLPAEAALSFAKSSEKLAFLESYIERLETELLLLHLWGKGLMNSVGPQSSLPAISFCLDSQQAIVSFFSKKGGR